MIDSTYKEWQYEFLLDSDEDYSKGNKVGELIVQGDRDEISELLLQTFVRVETCGIYFDSNCAIRFIAKRDTETPNKPRAFGKIHAVGTEENLDSFHDRLLKIIPRDGLLLKKYSL